MAKDSVLIEKYHLRGSGAIACDLKAKKVFNRVQKMLTTISFIKWSDDLSKVCSRAHQ